MSQQGLFEGQRAQMTDSMADAIAVLQAYLPEHPHVALAWSGRLNIENDCGKHTLVNCAICGKETRHAASYAGNHKTCGAADCRRAYLTRREFELRNQEREQLFAGGEPWISCMVCNRRICQMTPTHLRRHGLTMREYIETYPDAALVSSSMAAVRGHGNESRSLVSNYGGREPDTALFSFLTGSLLGDGSLERGKKILSRYVEGGKNEEYLRWKYGVLSAYFPTSFRERISAPHVKTGKRYRGWWIRTAMHPLIAEWRSAWYRPQKIVPLDIVSKYLNELALAVWFCDDGHHGKSASMMYTMAFSVDHVTWLMDLIASRFGIRTNLLRNKKGQPFLYVPAKSRPILDEILASKAIPGMAYKCGKSAY